MNIPSVSPAIEQLFQTYYPVLQSQWKVITGILFLAYFGLCQFFRFRAMKQLHAQFNYPTRESLAKMTNDEAQYIHLFLAEKEFGLVFRGSLAFAMIRTYGIPSISGLLIRTSQLTNGYKAQKRMADTAILLSEMIHNKPGGERSLTAIARINQLHAYYQAKGLISNDDMLYTLSMFALEPSRWVERFEWRTMTDMERCAIGVYWWFIAQALKIDLSVLEAVRRHANGNDGVVAAMHGEKANGHDGTAKTQPKFRDGLDFLDRLDIWSEAYEVQYMKPAKSNHILGTRLENHRLQGVPLFVKPHFSKCLEVFLGDRLSIAMGFTIPNRFYKSLVFLFISTRRFYRRWLSLASFETPKPAVSFHPDPQTGKYYYLKRLKYPFYYKPTFWSRWGPGSWITRIAGLAVPGAEGDKYFPGGYHVHEVGADAQFGADLKGSKEEVFRRKEELEDLGREVGRVGGWGGCPVDFLGKGYKDG